MQRSSRTLFSSLSTWGSSRGLTPPPVVFEVGHETEFPSKEIEHLFFVEEGMASITTTFKDKSRVEVGMFGYESMIGVSALMGTKRSLNRVYTQIEGRGYSCELEVRPERVRKVPKGGRLIIRARELVGKAGKKCVCLTVGYWSRNATRGSFPRFRSLLHNQ